MGRADNETRTLSVVRVNVLVSTESHSHDSSPLEKEKVKWATAFPILYQLNAAIRYNLWKEG